MCEGKDCKYHGPSAWAGLAAYVAAYDLWALAAGHKTLSKAFLDGLKTWHGRLALAVIWGWLTAHLFDLLPHKYDPIRRFADHA